jgi:2-keto-4-pentenoate hydratase/2-oxohepta-3-ene-1,7-dioic acid hydratase in catechol pathway
MKLVRYRFAQETGYGAVIEGRVHRLEASPWRPQQPGEALAPLDQVELLAPCQPTKILGVGRNYAAHAAEHHAPVPSEPLLFLKPPNSVIGPGEAIVYPEHLSQQVEHEAELAVVIGRRARFVPPGEALDSVLGYTCANDVTARDLQARDAQWARAKGFDTFCPLGPWIETDLDIRDLSVCCWVNGELRQQGRTREMIFSVPELIAYISAVMTLEPGDVLLTGTPAGVSPLLAGDRVSVEIEGIGSLWNEVVRHE